MKSINLLPDYSISPVIKGNWQLSAGHNLSQPGIDESKTLSDLHTFYEAGINTFDFGDIYTGVEELMGKFLKQLRERYGHSVRETIRLHTKYVPDRSILPHHNAENVRAIVERSLTRMGVDTLDLVQFHWWDYEVDGYLEALQTLFDLKSEGLITQVGLTNFDQIRLQEFIAAGLTPLSIQVQYSLLDRRPEKGMTELCNENGIHIFSYGTVAGGFLSEKYLGQEEPCFVQNRSLVKYKLIIEEFGSWALFQELLSVLNGIAQKHGADIATIASAYILSRPQVAGVIIGSKDASHLDANLKIASIHLDEQDLAQIQNILARAKQLPGDVYTLERTDQKHAGIMKTNLNTG